MKQHINKNCLLAKASLMSCSETSYLCTTCGNFNDFPEINLSLQNENEFVDISCKRCNGKKYLCTRCMKSKISNIRNVRLHLTTCNPKSNIELDNSSTFFTGPEFVVESDNVFSTDMDSNESSPYQENVVCNVNMDIQEESVEMYVDKNVNINDEEETVEMSIHQETVELSYFEYMGDVRCQIYHYQEHIKRTVDEGGFCGIVARAIECNKENNAKNNRIIAADLDDFVSNRDATLLLDLTMLLNELTLDQKKHLMGINGEMVKIINESNGTKPEMKILNAMTCYQAMNKVLLTGPNSIMMSLPTCTITTINEHPCISLVEKVNQLLAFGVPMSFYDPNKKQVGLNDSIAMKNLWDRMKKLEGSADSLVGHLIPWSDACHVTHLRNSTKGVWLFVVSICPENSSKINEYHTHILSMGLKAWDHEPVIEYYLEEVKKLNTPTERYYGKTKKKVLVQFDVLMYEGDLPERLSITGLRGSSSKGENHNLVFAHNVFYDEKKMPSCKKCMEKRKNLLKMVHDSDNEGSMMETNHTCSVCRDWELDGDTIPFQSSWTKNYPKGKENTIRGIKFPHRRTTQCKHRLPTKHCFEQLAIGCKAAMCHYIPRRWTVTQFQNYIKELGVNEKIETKMKIEAKQIREKFTKEIENQYAERIKETKNTAIMKKGISPDQVKSYLEKKMKVKKIKFKSIPKLWESTLTINSFVCAPMHWYMGIVKALVATVREYAVRYKKAERCTAHVADIMIQVKKLNLRRCRLLSFSDGKNSVWTVGWLCDNSVAFARIMPAITNLIFEDVINKKTMEGSSETSVLPNPDLHQCIINLITSFYILSSNLFSPKKKNTTYLELCVKEFLSCVRAFEIKCDFMESSTHLASKPNFLTSLTIPRQIEEYGELKYMNELNMERECQLGKKIMEGMRQTPSFLNKRLQKMESERVLCVIAARSCFDQESTREYGHEIKIYEDKEEIQDMFLEHEAVSGYRIDNKETGISFVYVFYGSKTELHMAQLEFANDGGRMINGLWYQKVSITNQIVTTTHSIAIGELNMPCLLFPSSVADDTKNAMYTVISLEDWTVRNNVGQFSIMEYNY